MAQTITLEDEQWSALVQSASVGAQLLAQMPGRVMPCGHNHDYDFMQAVDDLASALLQSVILNTSDDLNAARAEELLSQRRPFAGAAATTALRIAHPSGEGPVLHSWLTTGADNGGRTARTFYAAELMERVRAVMGRDASEALSFTVETVLH